MLALGIAIYPFAPDLTRGKLEVTVLDVGRGDAILTAFPDGTTMLVDAGGVPGMPRVQHVGGARASFDIGEEVVSPYLWHRGLKHLDVVAVTHAHQDHLGGVYAVLENFRVRELWVGRDVSRPAYRAVLEAAQARGVRVVHHIRGEQFSWDGASGRVLWPTVPLKLTRPRTTTRSCCGLNMAVSRFCFPATSRHRSSALSRPGAIHSRRGS